MPAPKSIPLDEHKDVLVAHEESFRSARGDDRKAIVRTIATEITSEMEELTAGEFQKLETVSRTTYIQHLLNVSHT